MACRLLLLRMEIRYVNIVLTAKASLDQAEYHDPARFTTLLRESVAALERIPGVTHAAVGLSLPCSPR